MLSVNSLPYKLRQFNDPKPGACFDFSDLNTGMFFLNICHYFKIGENYLI